MIATHEFTVLGPAHLVEMSLTIAVEFDEQGRAAEILVRPPGGFRSPA